MTALILAGHGSHISPHTAGLVWHYVDRLRRQRAADEITACFWKEPPSFHDVLNTVQARDVIIVPVFTAQGYFSQTVIPAEMGLSGPVTIRDGRRIYYTPTLGEHPALHAVMRQRVVQTLEAARLDPQEVAVVVIGHGTDRDARSQDAARQQADHLRATGLAAEVSAVYLNGAPPIQSIYETVSAPQLIAVPFFLAPGSHVTQDVPRALGLAPGEASGTVRGKRVYYADPVGTDATICALIADLAREHFPRQERGADVAPRIANETMTASAPADEWGCFPAVGQAALWDAVQTSGGITFGQLRLTRSEVRPVHGDATAAPLTGPAALRQHVREQSFSPLPTARDVPGDWCVKVTAAHVPGAVVETVYPGALAAWARQRRGTFRASSLRALGARQKGIFRHIDQLPAEVVDSTVATTCGNCVRFPAWYRPGGGEIPCAEPCNLWLSIAKEASV